MTDIAALLVLFALCFATILGLLAACGGIGEGKGGRVSRRLGLAEAVPKSEAASAKLLKESKSIDRRLRRLPWAQKVRRFLDQAGIEASTQLFIGFILSGLLAVGLLGYGMSGRLFVALFADLGACALLHLFIARKKARRIAAFTRLFPDALDLMGGALRAGHAFTATLEVVADEMPEPISGVFRQAFEQQKYGMGIAGAMRKICDSVDSLDVRFFATAVLIQRETGGNMAEILDRLSDTIRERFKLLGQVKTYTAQGRLSGYVLGLLPLAIGGALAAVNPDYMKVLVIEPVGRAMLIGAAILQVFGFLLIRKIIRIEV